jgi:hypothetical protein
MGRGSADEGLLVAEFGAILRGGRNFADQEKILDNRPGILYLTLINGRIAPEAPLPP